MDKSSASVTKYRSESAYCTEKVISTATNMNSDTSSGENSGNSNSSDKSKTSKKSRSVRTQRWTPKSMTDHDEGAGSSREALYDYLMDRESAAKAVAMVVHAASKRGYVHLCAEFASLIRQNKRMELEIKRLKFVLNQMQVRASKKNPESLQYCSSSSASDSGSGGSQGLKNKESQLKVTATKSPVQVSQTIPDRRCSLISRDSHSAPVFTQGNNCPTSKELKKAKEQIIRLSSQVKTLAVENQTLKEQVQNAEIQNDSTMATKPNKSTKDITSPDEKLQSSPSKSLQSSPSKETLNHTNEKPEENCCMKSCVKHRRRHGSKTLTAKLSTDSPAKLSIDDKPISVGSSLTPLQLYKNSQPLEKNQNRSTPLPKIGDYVTVQGEIKGYVNYVGPVKGETSHFVGIQLPSPVGNNDGTMDGVKYFTCPQNYGAFVPLKDINQVVGRPSTPFPF